MDDQFFTDIAQTTPRLDVRGISSRGISGSNTNILLGNSRVGYVLVDTINKQIVVADSAGNKAIFDPNGLVFKDSTGTTLINVAAATQKISIGSGGEVVLDAPNKRINVGGTNLIIDGANQRILLNDGVTNRVVIGNV